MPASPDSTKKWLTLAAMCTGLFMVMLDATIVANALPTIQRDLKMSTTGLQWVNNAYTLVIGALVIASGRIGDLYGRRRFFAIGVLAFACGSALSGAAQSDVWLILSRAFQGTGAAFMTPLTLSIIDDAFPPEERGRAIGIWAGVSGLALSIGPLLGGVLTQDASWRWIFFVNVPVAVVALAITARYVRESRDPTASRQLDVPGLVTVSGGLFGVVLGMMEGRAWGWSSSATIACLAGGAGLILLFVQLERRVPEPLVRVGLFRSSTFSGANVIAFLISFAMLGALFFLPLYMQDVRGFDPIGSGIAILPITLLVTVGAPISGQIADKLGPKWPMVAGLALTGLAFGLLGGTDVNTSYPTLVGPFVLLGFGIGLVMSPMSTAALNSAPTEQAGAASGVLNMNRQVGGTFGIALLGVIFSNAANTRLYELAAGLPAPIRAQVTAHGANASSNPQAITSAVSRLPAALAHQIVLASKEVFVSGLSSVLYTSAGVAVAGVVLGLIMIRAPAPALVPAVRRARARAAPCSVLTHHHHPSQAEVEALGETSSASARS